MNSEKKPSRIPVLICVLIIVVQAIVISMLTFRETPAPVEAPPAAPSATAPPAKMMPLEEAALVLSEHKDNEVRAHAVAIMGTIGGRSVEARLIELAKTDSYMNTRNFAIESLETMKSSQLVPTVLEMFESERKEVARSARQVILRLNDRFYAPEFLKALPGIKDPDAYVAVCKYISQAKDPALMEKIVSMFEAEKDLRRSTGLAIAMGGSLAKDNLPLLIKSVDRIHEITAQIKKPEVGFPIVVKLSKMKDPEANAVLGYFVISPDKQVQEIAVKFAIAGKHPDAIRKLVDAYPNLQSRAKRVATEAFKKGRCRGVKYDEKAGKYVYQ